MSDAVPSGIRVSPLTPEILAEGRISISGLQVVGRRVWWSESRPTERGRQVVLRADLSSTGESWRHDHRLATPADSSASPTDAATAFADLATASTEPEEVTPTETSVRSRVHEYGGGAFWVDPADESLYFTDLVEQALWRLDDPGNTHRDRRVPGRGETCEYPLRLTPPAPSGESHRYADARRIPGCEWLVALRERHHPGGVDDQIVAVPARETGPVVVLLAGRDFYAAPRPSPSGRHLAWLCWDHPNMPWDGCELWIADLDGPRLNARLLLAGGVTESVGQPTWSPDGRLWFTSDRAGWWQPYRTASFEKDAGPSSDAHRRQTERVCGEEAEFHSPDWVLGQKTFDFLSDGTLIARMRRSGVDQIVAVDATSGEVAVVPQPCVTISSLAVARLSNSVPAARSASEEVGLGDELVVVLGATPDQPAGIYEVQATRAVAAIGVVQTTYGPRTRTGATASEKAAEDLVRYFHLRSPTKAPLDANRVSRSRPMDFETVGGVKAHLLYFEPVDAFSEAAEKPPLVVWCHGGPTGAVEPGFDAGIQFWTSRGIAVAAVDYRGSAGYGRAYRELLTGLWGVADAEDCAAAARFLVGEGFCDGGRVAIRGASAGGLTALRAATPGGPFAAAVVAYGVSDLRTLAQDTHKFESRYLDGLVGPWPEAAEIYDERSPARHPEWVGVPVLLLQGSEDPVVPPSQASRLANSLRARGIRCDHVVFEGEGHGFRRAETLAQAARAELAFLGEVLGLASLS